MESFDELLSFSDAEHERLIQKYFGVSSELSRFTMFAKLVEEVGELSECLLSSASYQRTEKLSVDTSRLDHELADVLLTACILARETGVDVKAALSEKIAEISRRTL